MKTDRLYRWGIGLACGGFLFDLLFAVLGMIHSFNSIGDEGGNQKASESISFSVSMVVFTTVVLTAIMIIGCVMILIATRQRKGQQKIAQPSS